MEETKMKRFTLVLFGAANFLLVMGVRPAAAQPQFPVPSQPAVSPYVNLLRSGSSPGVNYYGIVRPQEEFRNSFLRLQQDFNTQQTQPSPYGPLDTSGLPPTGHAAQFNTQARYFMTNGAQGSRTSGTNASSAGATPYRPSAVTAPQAPSRPSPTAR
jgi:hypothetical protein